jgi:cytoskeleton protein RodZ
MATVAEQLRHAREAAHLSVVQVVDITKMRADHIHALERGDYDVFMAPVYIRGFVRTYVRLLKLDEAVVVADLDRELAQTEKFREHPSLTPAQRTPLDSVMLLLTRIRWRIVLPVGVGLFIVAVALSVTRVLNEQRLRDPLDGIPPARYDPPPAGEMLALPNPPAPRRTP